jgi:hypothetical protein
MDTEAMDSEAMDSESLAVVDSEVVVNASKLGSRRPCKRCFGSETGSKSGWS